MATQTDRQISTDGVLQIRQHKQIAKYQLTEYYK